MNLFLLSILACTHDTHTSLKEDIVEIVADSDIVDTEVDLNTDTGTTLLFESTCAPLITISEPTTMDSEPAVLDLAPAKE